MKFGTKLVLCIILIITIILSCSRFIIVKQNFIHSMKDTIDKNTIQHTIKRYYLERMIINDIEAGKEITNETIIGYVKSLYLYMQTDSERTALFTENQELIYANVESEIVENIKQDIIFNKDSDIYYTKKMDGGYASIFSSYWEINDKSLYIVSIYDITDIYKERDRQMHDMGLADLVTLILASMLASILSLLLTNPIRKLNKASKEIANGNFSKRVEIRNKDEVGELASSFNIMAEQIENKIDNLNLVIKQKEDFVDAFTHEIKTPLTTIIGYSDMLRLKKCDEELMRKSTKLYLF